MNQKYFKSKNQPVLDKFGRILVSEGKVKHEAESKIRQYPLTAAESFVMPLAMFPIPELLEAWELFNRKLPNATAETFFQYLYHLQKDVAIDQQRANIKFFKKSDHD